MAICRRARRPLDEAITAVADIRCNAVMARTWMFGMAAATRTGLCLGDFRTGLSIIDIDGRPRSGGVESARRKPRACSLHVEAVLARVRPLSVVTSSGVSDCSDWPVTDLDSVKRFRGFAALETIYPANETSFLIRRRPPETGVRHNLTSNDSGGCHEHDCKRSRQRTSGTANH
jgi:hypothetical protein